MQICCYFQEAFYGRDVILADRDMVEQQSGVCKTVIQSHGRSQELGMPAHPTPIRPHSPSNYNISRNIVLII